MRGPAETNWTPLPLGRSQRLERGSCISLDEPRKGFLFTLSVHPPMPRISSSRQHPKQRTSGTGTPVNSFAQWEKEDLQMGTPALFNLGQGLIPGLVTEENEAEY